MRVLVKFLAYLLTFVLGFLSCIGAIVGVGFYIYTSVSIDTVRGFGVEINTDDFLDKEAEIPVETMTIQKLVEEIQYLASISEDADLDMLIERYGVKLPEEIEEYIPDGVRNVPLAKLFSEEGFNAILEGTEVDYILSLVPEGIVSQQAIDALSGKTLDYVVAMDLGYLLDGVLLGYVTGVTYEKDASGNYNIVYADPAQPTTIELLAAIDLGALLSAVTGAGGDTYEVIKEYVGDVMVETLASSLMDLSELPLPGLFGDKTVADMIVLDEDTGEYYVDVFVLIDGSTVGDLLGYHYDETADKWYEEEGGAEVDALFAALCGVSCSELMDPGVESETGATRTQMDVIFDAIGTMQLGHIMGYTFGDHDGDGAKEWYKQEGDTYTYPENAEKAILNIEMADVLGDDPVNDAFGGIYVGELMGYERADNPDYNPEAPESAANIWYDADGVEIAPLYAKIADYTVASLMDGGLNTDDLMDGLIIADVLDLEALADLPVYIDGATQVTDLEKPITVWVDQNGVATNNMMNSVAGLGISNVDEEMNAITLGDICGVVQYSGEWYSWSHDQENQRINLTEDSSLITDLAHITIEQFANNDFEHEIQSVKIGRFVGYTLGDDGKWYNGDELVDGGIISAFTDLNLDDLKNEDTVQAAVQGIAVSEVLGYSYDETTGEWLDGNGVAVTGVMREIADCNVGGLNDRVKTMTIGDVAGYELVNGEWQKDDEKATGILGALAELTMDDVTNESILSEKIKTVSVAEIFGYTKDGDTWYDGTKKVTGVMAVIADAGVGSIQEKLDETKMGYILGYELDDGVWKNSAGETVDGLMSAVSDTLFSDLDTLYTTLSISDVIPPEQFESGFLSIIPQDTKLNLVGEVVNDTFAQKPVGELIDAGVINLEEETCDKLDTIIGESWRSEPLPTAIQHIVDSLLEKIPVLP